MYRLFHCNSVFFWFVSTYLMVLSFYIMSNWAFFMCVNHLFIFTLLTTWLLLSCWYKTFQFSVISLFILPIYLFWRFVFVLFVKNIFIFHLFGCLFRILFHCRDVLYFPTVMWYYLKLYIFYIIYIHDEKA